MMSSTRKGVSMSSGPEVEMHLLQHKDPEADRIIFLLRTWLPGGAKDSCGTIPESDMEFLLFDVARPVIVVARRGQWENGEIRLQRDASSRHKLVIEQGYSSELRMLTVSITEGVDVLAGFHIFRHGAGEDIRELLVIKGSGVARQMDRMCASYCMVFAPDAYGVSDGISDVGDHIAGIGVIPTPGVD